jgi:hypothetical protein
MRHFKLPLLVTAITLLLAVIVGVIMITSIHRSQTSSARKLERAQIAGGGVAVAACVVVAPFWLFAAAKVGKERRQARELARKQTRGRWGV